jgi:hypothetical protein
MRNGFYSTISCLFLLFVLFLISCQKYERISDIQINSYDVTDTSTSSVIVKFALIDLGKNNIKQFGVCIDTSDTFHTPKYYSYDTVPVERLYTKKIVGLNFNTRYFAKAYIVSNDGKYSYSPAEMIFNTAKITSPSFSIDTVHFNFGITWVTFAIEKASFYYGNDPSTIFGICYSDLLKPSIYDDTVLINNNQDSIKITNLIPNTKYTFYAFAKNRYGINYTTAITLNTTKVALPSYTINTSHLSYTFGINWAVFAINKASFYTGNDPNSNSTYGICYSSHTNTPTTSDSTIIVNKGQDSVKIPNLEPNTEYTFRAYAKNKFGTNYTTLVSIRTSVLINGIEMVQLNGAVSTGGLFYISRYEVSKEVWDAIINSEKPQSKGTLPKNYITQTEIYSFLQKLNLLDIGISNFRLPTPAQWQYAANGKTGNDTYVYSGSNNINDVAFYNSNASNKPQQIGKKKPNSAGIYDMSGNIAEIIDNGNSMGGSCSSEANLCKIGEIQTYKWDASPNTGIRLVKT